MEEIDTHLFLEIILDGGANYLTRHQKDDLIIEFYEGPSRRKVQIIVSDEFISRLAAIGYLGQFGMGDIVDRLFR